MNKPVKVLSATAIAAVLAATTLVPNVVAESVSEVPAEAKQLDKFIFDDNGISVSFDLKPYYQALGAKKVESKITHIQAKDGSTYLIKDYQTALGAGKTPERALELLYKSGKKVDIKIVPGELITDPENERYKEIVAKNNSDGSSEDRLNETFFYNVA